MRSPYGLVAASRRRWFERQPHLRQRLDRPVISIGNLSVGGTGKTPLVRVIAEWLVARGERPAILSRGYGRMREVDGVTVVSDGERVLGNVAIAGDEPMMLARQVAGAAVLVGARRFVAGRLAERALGCTVHLLDDGFQHVQLERDLDLLVTYAGEAATGRLLPFGRLREPVAAASRAQMLVVMDVDAEGAAAEAWALGIGESCGARRVIGEPITADGAVSARAVPLDKSRPVVAFAGIGRPRRFFDDLRGDGWTISREMTFPDHHSYTARDIASIAHSVHETGSAAALTTEKDAVRLDPIAARSLPLAQVPLQSTFDSFTVLEGVLSAGIARGRARLEKRRVWPPMRLAHL